MRGRFFRYEPALEPPDNPDWCEDCGCVGDDRDDCVEEDCGCHGDTGPDPEDVLEGRYRDRWDRMVGDL